MRLAGVIAFAVTQTGQAFLQTGRAHVIGPRFLHSAQSQQWGAGSFLPLLAEAWASLDEGANVNCLNYVETQA